MPVPEGFYDLVGVAAKERPGKPKDMAEVWNRFLAAALMGAKRSEPEIRFLLAMLKKQVDMQFLLKTPGEDWREEVQGILTDRIARMQDESMREMLQEFGKELFRISASLKGAARFFGKMTLEQLDEALATREKTKEFVDALAENQDVPNVKFTKIIIWLHSIGYAGCCCPPSWQTKKFVNNEIGPYYQFYEDDRYFMKKAEELSEEIKKEVPVATARDVSVAIFYYMSLKSMMPERSKEKKACTPKTICAFLKKKKMSLAAVAEKLAAFDGRERLAEELYAFLRK